ncbi:MAG: U32 family peptidase [Erysipelotrichaceae bacterium]|nr:U32 family peptidase [Erysipelotrichaceae bacterium]
MRKAELLAPAGNFECLKAAIKGGADAVYLGGKNFSARAFAKNFDSDELEEAVRYAHLRNVRIFVTINTLMSDNEINNALKIADYYYRINVDALLVQDLGLFYVLKERYPDFELHCSTQMHVHNIEGVRNAKKLGFSRVVLARESTLDLIQEACKEGIEIETFVHGAICVSYSGQCLMSSVTKKRSANRGMCAQCCRLRYELYDEEDKRIKTDTDYLLSPKDMFLLNDIPDLIEAGVSSFKIEGRMKSAAYVQYVTSLYRKAIDNALSDKPYSLSDEEMSDLKVLFNRNFTNDLLHGKSDLFGQKTPNHLGIPIGKTVSFKQGRLYFRLDSDLSQFDGIRINDFGCIVNRLYKDGFLVSHAQAGDIVAIDAKENLSGLVFKTLDHNLEEKLLQNDEKHIPISIHVELKPENKARLTVKTDSQVFKYESDIIVQKALKAPLNKDNLLKAFSRLNETAYYLDSLSCELEDAFLTIKDLNEIRRNMVEALDEFRLSSFKRTIYPRTFEYHELTDEDYEGQLIENGDEAVLNDAVYPVSYVINTESIYPEGERALISDFGGLLKDYEAKIAYYTLNCANSYTYEFLKRCGFKQIILSTELHDNEIADLIKAYKERNNIVIRPYIFKNGNRVLMYIKTNPLDRYMDKQKHYYLSDGSNDYLIRHSHEITELIETDKDHNLNKFNLFEPIM